MHPEMTVLLTLLLAALAHGMALDALVRRSSLLGGYAGGFANGYIYGEPHVLPYVPAAKPPRAVSHIRQQIYAESVPHARYLPYATGYSSRTLHALPERPPTSPSFPVLATSSSYQPHYAGSTPTPSYSLEDYEYEDEAGSSEALAESAPKIYDSVLYARPNERGGYSYRRRPGHRTPSRHAGLPYAPILIKIHKRKIIRD